MIGRALLERLLFPPPRFSAARLARAVGGRTMVITGASYGVGEATARLMARAGAHVVLIARTAEKLDELRAIIEREGGRATCMPADLTDADAVEALVRSLLALPNGVDALVSNAGKSIRRPLMASLDRFHDITRTNALNFLAPARLVLALIPMLRDRGGQVISVSAANVLLSPAPYWAAYQASKAGFDQWLRSAEPELAAAGIAVSTLYLALVRTRMIAPTEAYRNAPAMSPDDAARRLCRMAYTRRRRWRPWWLPPAALASLLLDGLWARIARATVRRDQRRGA